MSGRYRSYLPFPPATIAILPYQEEPIQFREYGGALGIRTHTDQAGATKLAKSSPCMVSDQASETGPPRQVTSPTSFLKWPWRIKSVTRLKQRIDQAICWKNENSLWRNGLAMHCQVAKQPDKGKELPELNQRMEMRQTLELQAFDFQRFICTACISEAAILAFFHASSTKLVQIL